jgi:hypothetical protein
MGVQQGDPMGPFLFSLVLNVVVTELRVKFPSLDLNEWYLDDGVLAGPVEVVRSAFDLIGSLGPDLGLNLNLKKCEVFANSQLVLDSFPRELQKSLNPDLVLLGSPIGGRVFCEQFVAAKKEVNERLLGAIGGLGDPQVGLHLLRSCASFCKIAHIIRTTPRDLIEDGLHSFDDSVMVCLENCAALSLDLPARNQARLGVDQTGLGLRSTFEHADAAFVPSVAFACSKSGGDFLADADVLVSVARLEARVGRSIAAELQGNVRQAALSYLVDDALLREQLAAAVRKEDRARLLSLAAPHSSDWLRAAPAFGAFEVVLTPDEMQVALQLRLGLPVAPEGAHCPACRRAPRLDPGGHHALTCSKGADVVTRHNKLRNTVKSLCSRAQMSASLEQGASGSDMQRPADVLVQAWSLGSAAALDITVVSPFAVNNINEAGDLGGVNGVVARAEERKLAANGAKCRELGWRCIPLAVDSFGCWGGRAARAFDKISGPLATQLHVSRGEALRCIYSALGCILVRQNSRAVLSRRVVSGDLLIGAREVRQAAPECFLDAL